MHAEGEAPERAAETEASRGTLGLRDAIRNHDRKQLPLFFLNFCNGPGRFQCVDAPSLLCCLEFGLMSVLFCAKLHFDRHS